MPLRERFGWGGRRAGAGRPKGPNSETPHTKRPALASRYPVHVTVRVMGGLPSLRARSVFKVVRRGLSLSANRFGFRVVHYSVQRNHMHLVVEAKDTEALSRGMKGLQVRIARGLNSLLGRRGKVFTRRFHARILKTPTEVKRALLYVLNNAKHHARQMGRRLNDHWLDPCSSSPGFDGWKKTGPPRAPPTATGVASARTWLLNVGWRQRGLLDPAAVPG